MASTASRLSPAPVVNAKRAVSPAFSERVLRKTKMGRVPHQWCKRGLYCLRARSGSQAVRPRARKRSRSVSYVMDSGLLWLVAETWTPKTGNSFAWRGLRRPMRAPVRSSNSVSTKSLEKAG